MITSEDVQRIFPKAVQWVTQMEQACMEMGQPLLPQNRQDGEMIGIRELAAVRVMVLNEMPAPSDPELRQLAAGMTFGHGLVLKAGHFNRKRLTIGAVDGVAGFRRLVADSPSGGREFSDSIDGKIGQARKHRAQIVANW